MPKFCISPRGRFFVQLLLLAAFAFTAALSCAQESGAPAGDDPAVTMFPHSETASYWISAQDNIISQWHPAFFAKYSGANSLRPKAENAVSNVFTLYTGYSFHRNTEFFLDIESASGGGLSDALGLAGFTNLDVVRSPDLGSKPYLARALVR